MSDITVSHPVIELVDVAKTYQLGAITVQALRTVSLSLEAGDFLAIMGPSGSGKSTLMNILGCLDLPTGGRYLLDGVDVASISEAGLCTVRNRKIGFVFQSYNLVPRTNALRNVELPLIYAGVPGPERRQRALGALEAVGLADRVHHMPNEMSGGQQQRAAVARAIVTNPAMVLADEPTGNLDSTASREVMAIFVRLNAEGRTVVVITHEEDIAAYASRIIRLRDGEVVSDEAGGAADRHTSVLSPPQTAHADLGEPR